MGGTRREERAEEQAGEVGGRRRRRHCKMQTEKCKLSDEVPNWRGKRLYSQGNAGKVLNSRSKVLNWRVKSTGRMVRRGETGQSQSGRLATLGERTANVDRVDRFFGHDFRSVRDGFRDKATKKALDPLRGCPDHRLAGASRVGSPGCLAPTDFVFA